MTLYCFKKHISTLNTVNTETRDRSYNFNNGLSRTVKNPSYLSNEEAVDSEEIGEVENEDDDHYDDPEVIGKELNDTYCDELVDNDLYELDSNNSDTNNAIDDVYVDEDENSEI